ncbi:TPA: hypothetical protein OOF41_004268 [Citrobacter freundii]|nr:hypothetical protein [Citrobacter freundii]
MNSKLLGLIFCAYSFAATAATDDNWIKVQESDQTDFQIRCYEGTNLVWGIYPRNNLSDYQVARNIYINNDNGRTVLKFKRGRYNADTTGMYIATSNESCELSAK